MSDLATHSDPVRTNGKSRPILELTDVSVDYSYGRMRRPHRALDHVTATVYEGETLAVVGESGSGKTTITKAVLGYMPIASGSISFDGNPISEWSPRQRRNLARDLQIIYQDPFRSLSPTRTVGQTLEEPLLAHSRPDRRQLRDNVDTMISRVGLPAGSALKYPGELSGGERQRVAIARALMLSPRLVLCDEPVSALDISIQGQILNLLSDLQGTLSLSYLFISHNISVVRYFAERVLVLYMGRVMEVGDTRQVCEAPVHPYTRALLDAVPDPDPDVQRERRLRRKGSVRSGEAPTAHPTTGCVYADRCSYALDACHKSSPVLAPVSGGSLVACHRSIELVQKKYPDK